MVFPFQWLKDYRCFQRHGDPLSPHLTSALLSSGDCPGSLRERSKNQSLHLDSRTAMLDCSMHVPWCLDWPASHASAAHIKSVCGLPLLPPPLLRPWFCSQASNCSGPTLTPCSCPPHPSCQCSPRKPGSESSNPRNNLEGTQGIITEGRQSSRAARRHVIEPPYSWGGGR